MLELLKSIKNKVLGFETNKDKEDTRNQYDKMKESIMGELKQKFKPEFLNRIDDINSIPSIRRVPYI